MAGEETKKERQEKEKREAKEKAQAEREAEEKKEKEEEEAKKKKEEGEKKKEDEKKKEEDEKKTETKISGKKTNSMKHDADFEAFMRAREEKQYSVEYAKWKLEKAEQAAKEALAAASAMEAKDIVAEKFDVPVRVALSSKNIDGDVMNGSHEILKINVNAAKRAVEMMIQVFFQNIEKENAIERSNIGNGCFWANHMKLDKMKLIINGDTTGTNWGTNVESIRVTESNFKACMLALKNAPFNTVHLSVLLKEGELEDDKKGHRSGR